MSYNVIELKQTAGPDPAAQREASEMTLYRDERGQVISIDQLKQEYNELKQAGETEAETFNDYLINCTDQDGTLTEIRRQAK